MVSFIFNTVFFSLIKLKITIGTQNFHKYLYKHFLDIVQLLKYFKLLLDN